MPNIAEKAHGGNKVPVMLVDDHAMLRDMLASHLEADGQFRVVAKASNADQAVTMAFEHHPRLVIMDIDMPGIICFDAARTIQSRLPEVRFMFLSAFFHDRYIEQALSVQARGYVTKGEPAEIILEAVRKIAAGGTYFSEQIRERLVIDSDGVRLAKKGHTRASTLTTRELEVLRYVARGMSKKEIAKAMFLSVKTVENYSSRLMNKLDIHDRVDLARYAIREGLAEA